MTATSADDLHEVRWSLDVRRNTDDIVSFVRLYLIQQP